MRKNCGVVVARSSQISTRGEGGLMRHTSTHFLIQSVVTVICFLNLSLPANAQEELRTLESQIKKSEILGDEKGVLPEGVWKALSDFVERFDLKVRLTKDYDKEDFGGGGGWERRLEPSYRQGYTSLIDDYRFVARLTPGKLSGGSIWDGGGEGTQYFVGPGGIVRFMFARQYLGNSLMDRLRIATEPLYDPVRHFPWSTNRALKKLKIGDFVSFQVQLNLVVRGAQIQSFAPGVLFVADASYILSGEFQVHLMRISDEKFRLKLIGIRGRDTAGGVRFGYSNGSDFTVTKLSFLDRAVTKRLSFSPFEINWHVPRSNLFLVDYELDFTDPEVASAYDQLISTAWNTETFKILNPFNGREELRELLLSDVSAFEKLFDRERRKRPESRTVDRRFRGNNEIMAGSGMSIRVGHHDIAEARVNQTYTENFITSVDRRGRERHFIMPLYNISGGWRAGFGFFDEELNRSSSLLMEADKNQRINSFGELSFYLEYRDKKFTSSEIRDLKEFIKARLPEGLFDQIDWKDWADERDRDQARVTSLLVFRPDAVKLITGLDAIEIQTNLIAYLKSLPRIEAWPDTSLLGNEGDEGRIRATSPFLDFKYQHDLNKIIHSLVVSLNYTDDGLSEEEFDALDEAVKKRMWDEFYVENKKRVEAFVGLRTNPLWQEIGSGFLVQLLQHQAKKKYGGNWRDEFLKNVYYETTWDAKDADTVQESVGRCNNRRLYKAVMYMYTLLSNRSMEMRLIDDDVPWLPNNSKLNQCEE